MGAAPIATGADLSTVARVLAENRDAIVEGWLDAAAKQPFHAGRRERAVADHIPRLLDALFALLVRVAPPSIDPGAPLDDPSVLDAAQNHARARFEQGLQPTDIVTEFRLLRKEIGRALRYGLPDDVPAGDVVGAELFVHDALDGAITLGLDGLTSHIEEVREDFLATTIHDTLQPLSTIRGLNQLAGRALEQQQVDRAHIRDYLMRSTVEADRMAELLATLAEVSRLSLGRLTLQIVSTDLGELVRSVVLRVPPEDVPRIRVELPADADLTGDWDPKMLARVIGNLLSNALKYSVDGDRVDVGIRVARDEVELWVRDYGIGLTLDDLAWLFRRYGRGRGASDRGIQGVGLGLYLSHGIIEAHGGRLWAESAGRDQGTTMHMRLPRSVPPPLDQADLGASAAAGTRSPPLGRK